MLYTLKSPCQCCPFRTDIKFPLNRAKDIADGLLNDRPFACHNTTTTKGRSVKHKDAQHCAGALIVLEKMNKPHQAMLLGMILNKYNNRDLKLDSPVYDTLDEFVEGTNF